jgi:hypothetical protein
MFVEDRLKDGAYAIARRIGPFDDDVGDRPFDDAKSYAAVFVVLRRNERKGKVIDRRSVFLAHRIGDGCKIRL